MNENAELPHQGKTSIKFLKISIKEQKNIPKLDLKTLANSYLLKYVCNMKPSFHLGYATHASFAGSSS